MQDCRKSTHVMNKQRIETYAVGQLNQFLASGAHNQWLRFPTGDVYVRKGFHKINGQITNTLDIANISIKQQFRGKGIGTTIFESFHQNNPFPMTFVESVINERLEQWLERNQWLSVEWSNPPCFYKNC